MKKLLSSITCVILVFVISAAAVLARWDATFSLKVVHGYDASTGLATVVVEIRPYDSTVDYNILDKSQQQITLLLRFILVCIGDLDHVPNITPRISIGTTIILNVESYLYPIQFFLQHPLKI